jgi:flagellar motor protein MotB
VVEEVSASSVWVRTSQFEGIAPVSTDKMLHEEEPQEIVSYWPSVSDLFMTMFIIGLAMLAVSYYVLTPKLKPGDEKIVVEAVGMDMRRIRNPVNRMRNSLGNIQPIRETQSAREVVTGLEDTSNLVVERLTLLASANKQASEWERLANENATLKTHIRALTVELNDKPPIIRIDEATKEYRFDSGSAVMNSQFAEGLNHREFQTLAQEILRRNSDARLKVDTLEIIGHTDGQPISRKGNLDQALPAYLAGRDSSVNRLQAGSNNDLGLMRALAVRDAWYAFLSMRADREQLGRINVRCYSAGQTIPATGDRREVITYERSDEGSRRIEVRLTKLD